MTDMASLLPPPATDYRYAIGKAPGGLLPALREDLSVSRDVFAALTYALEMARCGAMLVTVGGQVQIANRAALALLQKKDGIGISRSAIVADRPSDTRHLQRLVQEAITNPQCGEPAQSPFTLARKFPASALVVRVEPGPELKCWNSASQRSALVKIYDRDPDLAVDEKSLTSVYGLTRGEASLATKLAQGKSIEVAANELCISKHTARTHLKRIFVKTDTHRQPELVLRMLVMAL